MNARARAAVGTALRAALEEGHVLDEAALTKALKRAAAEVIASEEFVVLMNEKFVEVLERQGLRQFTEDDYLIGVAAAGLSDQGFLFDLVGPGVGPSECSTIEVK